jgi:DNA-directed RNA polymerase specialized sigma subunit
MTNLKMRLQRLELDHPSFKPDFSLMTDEELEKLVVDLTRDSLRSKLNREPTEEEVAKERDMETSYVESLTTQELFDLRENLRKQT